MSWPQSILPIRRRSKAAKSAIVKTPKITRCAHDPKRGNSNVASLALLADGVSKGRERDARTHQPLHAKIVEKHCFWLAITMLAALPTGITTQQCHGNRNRGEWIAFNILRVPRRGENHHRPSVTLSITHSCM
ncbi:hypothetical protein COCCADRAFT_95169 [Bipolaris zeicola 26-R-13]|uniref:Uncharacterized protein n=1 Tax=Cochliobolus carbonum (strain 26-R-13) TaxID=930089 RepID=W6Y263_COCC2|nr:uncharacterized protein COCCADRAFT_95169 [Bipolaris zeicola 26-R-13]EUC33807.1 hypothetical protein COCCADRAFT_95169 [Bipolaris zeicola 26-R-13]